MGTCDFGFGGAPQASSSWRGGGTGHGKCRGGGQCCARSHGRVRGGGAGAHFIPGGVRAVGEGTKPLKHLQTRDGDYQIFTRNPAKRLCAEQFWFLLRKFRGAPTSDPPLGRSITRGIERTPPPLGRVVHSCDRTPPPVGRSFELAVHMN